jgi:hypothetical protein
LFVTGTVLPASKFRTVLSPTFALAAKSVWENSMRARAARHWAGVIPPFSADNDFQQGGRIAFDTSEDNDYRY